MTPLDWIGVGVLGGIGAIMRFTLAAAITKRTVSLFPWGTLVVNASGAFVLGILSASSLSAGTMLFAGTALIGSYTTFSTWMRESYHLGHMRYRFLAILNLLGSIAVGLTACFAGRYVAGIL